MRTGVGWQMGRGGFEPPTQGFSVPRSNNATLQNPKTCETAKQQLTPQLTPKSSKQPEIDTAELPVDPAEIVAIWPELPEPVKAGILAMVKGYVAQQSAKNDISKKQ